VHARHILFAVTEGINVAALAGHAEKALIELRHKDVAPGRFAELARTLSNCPSGADGGDLGWIGPDDCADELTAELFHTTEGLDAVGLHPRLVHSRYGFHIVEVLARDPGRRQSFEEVGPRIAVQLAQQSRAKALHQYMQLLAGRAEVSGLALEGADSPLVQ
jgi:peptidyl-prolyl cis-trans isomerase C